MRDPSCTTVLAWLVRRLFFNPDTPGQSSSLTGTVALALTNAFQFQFCFPLFSCSGPNATKAMNAFVFDRLLLERCLFRILYLLRFVKGFSYDFFGFLKTHLFRASGNWVYTSRDGKFFSLGMKNRKAGGVPRSHLIVAQAQKRTRQEHLLK